MTSNRLGTFKELEGFSESGREGWPRFRRIMRAPEHRGGLGGGPGAGRWSDEPTSPVSAVSPPPPVLLTAGHQPYLFLDSLTPRRRESDLSASGTSPRAALEGEVWLGDPLDCLRCLGSYRLLRSLNVLPLRCSELHCFACIACCLEAEADEKVLSYRELMASTSVRWI